MSEKKLPRVIILKPRIASEENPGKIGEYYSSREDDVKGTEKDELGNMSFLRKHILVPIHPGLAGGVDGLRYSSLVVFERTDIYDADEEENS